MDFTNVSQNYEAGTKVLASQFVFGLSRKTQWLSGLYYADFISFYRYWQMYQLQLAGEELAASAREESLSA